MESKKNEIYILCPRAGNPRKHIVVCRQCRYRKKCNAYRGYFQPGLPFLQRFEHDRVK